MSTGIDELDHLTLRAVEDLPAAAPFAASGFMVHFTSLLPDSIYDVSHHALIAFGDFGMYRVGRIHTQLIERNPIITSARLQ